MKKLFVVLLSLSMLLSLFSCKNDKQIKGEDKKPIQYMFTAFDTQCSISLYMDEKDEEWGMTYADDIENFLKKYEKYLSKTDPESDIYAINHRTGNSVMVSDPTAILMQLGSDFYNWSSGYFDISSGTLIDLWDIKNRKTLPSLEEINEARKHCGNFNYTIENNVAPGEIRCNKITFNGDSKSQYDLGALVKGYVCDGLRDMLAENDKIKASIINLGGNVFCTGKISNRVGGAFNIGIFKPFATKSEIIDTVKVVDKNVITSGTYQRYFKVPGDDKVYCHIINPKTGYPVDNEYTSVTIVSENGLLGDYMSTACLLLGYNKSLDFIDFCKKNFGDKNLQAIFIDNMNNILKYPKKTKHY